MTTKLAFSLAAIAFAASAAAASAQTRTITIPAGKEAGIVTVTSLRKDCSIGDVGGIKVTAPPKNGAFVIKSAKAKTPASFRCPNVETPIQVLMYKPKSGFNGADELQYETRTIEGSIETRTVKITVGKGDGKGDGKSGASGGLQEL